MTETGISHSTPPVLTTIPIAESQSSMPARHRYHHSSKRRKSFTITLESVFMFAWNRRSRCAGNSVHGGPEYAPSDYLRRFNSFVRSAASGVALTRAISRSTISRTALTFEPT
jgi:hypothetical protein